MIYPRNPYGSSLLQVFNQNYFRFEVMLITAMVLGIVGLLLSLLSLALIWIICKRGFHSAPLDELQMQDLTTRAQAQCLLATNAQG